MSLFVKRTKYYDGEGILSKDAFYNIVLGGKNIGKSFFYKKLCLDEAWTQDKKFVLMFRFESDRKTNLQIENYFEDDELVKYIKELTDNEYSCIRARAKSLYFGNKTGKNQFGIHIGFVCFLNKEESYNSSVFEGVYNILFEEFISRKGYLIDEPHILEVAVNTILRNRAFSGKARVILVGNLISKVNPYVSYWNLQGVLRQKTGSIEIYERQRERTDGQIFVLKIAVEICPDLDIGGIAVGRKMEHEEHGTWEEMDVPVLENWREKDFEELTLFVFVWDGFYFLCRVLTKDFDNLFIYVERKTTKIKPETRVIGKINESEIDLISSLFYTKNFQPLVEAERKIFSLIPQGKLLFSDAQTGTDFWMCYDSM